MKDFRVLAIDDNSSILDDYLKVLQPKVSERNLQDLELELFGQATAQPVARPYLLTTASQGQAGVELFRHAQNSNHPIGIVFVDMRMPPGWDGVETIEAILEIDPNVSIVLCTAYSDYSVAELNARLGKRQNFYILRKPFTPDEILQLVSSAEARTEAQEGPAGVTKADLLHGLESGEFSLAFQPIVWANGGGIKAFEALIRRSCAAGTGFTPQAIISYAEDNGAIHAIGDWVATEAIRASAALRRTFPYDTPKISFNASVLEFESGDYAQRLLAKLQGTGVTPSQLAVEVTESRLTSCWEVVSKSLSDLRSAGFEVLIDDFGTGFSTLYSLATLPCDVLKLDGAFAAAMHDEPAVLKVIAGTIAMAHSIGLSTVAERVETDVDLQILTEAGCDALQGYHLARPMSLQDATEWASEWNDALPRAA
jgi:EAL domain-containing protein (putative c-di-GMP-specific phosphodiesterase class I)/CheY-like chemotaxis protein